MEIFLLWATWTHEYMAIFVKIDGHRTSGHFKRARSAILTKLGQHVNEMMAVAAKKNLWSHFLIIGQNVNMATNAIVYSGLPPAGVLHGQPTGHSCKSTSCTERCLPTSNTRHDQY